MRRIILLLVLLPLAPSAVRAETVYVVDKIFVGLRAARVEGAALLKPLETGATLEVLERDERFVRVRDRLGTEGWIEARYVSAEPPARLQLARLQEELTKTKTQLAEAQDRLHKAEAAPAQAGKGVAPAAAANSPAEPSPASNPPPAESKEGFNYPWLAISLAMLVIGFLGGIVWWRETVRRKMGGMYLRI